MLYSLIAMKRGGGQATVKRVGKTEVEIQEGSDILQDTGKGK